MKRLYHGLPASSTPHRPVDSHPHPPLSSLSNGSFRDRENEFSYTMHKTPCGRTRRGDRLGPSPQLPIRANCLNLNQKKCKFLLCCRCCQAPFAHFFLCSLLF